MEKIISIVETTFTTSNGHYNTSYDGYVIKTTEQEIKLGIANGQCCCENYGYFTSEDDISRFIGSTLLDIKVVDEALNKEKLVDVYEGATMFVDIETNVGVLQFVAYNSHNGYYGHDALVISNQLNHSEYL